MIVFLPAADQPVRAEPAFESPDAPTRGGAGPDPPPMPFHHAMESFFMPDRAKIAAAARELAAY